MKLILCFSLFVVIVTSVEIIPKTLTREIKADVLRGNNGSYQRVSDFVTAIFNHFIFLLE
jgi:hypothetical protein